jgi:hypothetical protein
MRARRGSASAAEMLLVATLFVVVLAGAARLAGGQARLAALQQDRLRFEEAVRTTRMVLDTELRYAAPGDATAFPADSVRIRAFRGGGRVCAVGDDLVRVAYAGVRAPDPARDSVLLLAPDSSYVRGVASVRPAAGCGDGVDVTLTEPAGPDAGYALFFETGAYSLSDGAFRYRRGEGGRQPLTEAVLADIALDTMNRGLAIRVSPGPDSLRRMSARPRGFGIRILNPRVEP